MNDFAIQRYNECIDSLNKFKTYDLNLPTGCGKFIIIDNVIKHFNFKTLIVYKFSILVERYKEINYDIIYIGRLKTIDINKYKMIIFIGCKTDLELDFSDIYVIKLSNNKFQ
jgi:superfamily II DNA or RNA helicase